jgi:hypothetical protein
MSMGVEDALAFKIRHGINKSSLIKTKKAKNWFYKVEQKNPTKI